MDSNLLTIPFSVRIPTTIFWTFVRYDWHHQLIVLNRLKLSICRWFDGCKRTFTSVNLKAFRSSDNAVSPSIPSISAPYRMVVPSNFVVNIQQNSSPSRTGLPVSGSVVRDSEGWIVSQIHSATWWPSYHSPLITNCSNLKPYEQIFFDCSVSFASFNFSCSVLCPHK